ncbi:MAG TPA: slipin family protein [Patescibacteria group bacterium]|nr:slipin family protein [Patescibacteria group bacterium]
MFIQLLNIAILLPLLLVVIFLSSSIRILKEYERGVVFTLGRLTKTKGPGMVFVIPFIQMMVKMELRLVSIDVAKQEIMTRDNVPVTVDAVVYFKVFEPAKALVEMANYYQSTFLIAQTSLRSVLGAVELDELLSQREKINLHLQTLIDKQTEPWGVKVPIVEIKEITLPETMKRAMAKQAETERERRAKVIDAEGEYQAAEKLAQAAEILSRNPAALQLRYLQTLREVAVENNSTTLFPIPIDILTPFIKAKEAKST